jgi:hypothetical protein
MTYPPVTQFETHALEADALARLAWERRAGQPRKPRADRGRRFAKWVPLLRPAPRAVTGR